jgi:hypothetical protein
MSTPKHDIGVCFGCGGHFPLTHPDQKYCLECWRWNRTLRGLKQEIPASIDRKETTK